MGSAASTLPEAKAGEANASGTDASGSNPAGTPAGGANAGGANAGGANAGGGAAGGANAGGGNAAGGNGGDANGGGANGGGANGGGANGGGANGGGANGGGANGGGANGGGANGGGANGGGANGGANAGNGNAAPRPAAEFDALVGLIAGSADFGVNPPVSLDEALEFRRLFTVVNYVMARVPAAITALNGALRSTAGTTDATTLPLRDKGRLLDTHGARMTDILRRVAEDFDNEQAVLMQARAQFDLGTAAVPNVNSAFKGVYREFVNLCANDLLAVDPQAVQQNPLWDQRRTAELNEFLRRLRRTLLRLVENMSIAGSLGTGALVSKWAPIIRDALAVVRSVGADGHVADDDIDRRHIWSVVAELNRQSRESIVPFVVQAGEGGELLNVVVEAYRLLTAHGALQSDDDGAVRALFFDGATYGYNGGPIGAALRRNATLLQDNWIPGWA